MTIRRLAGGPKDDRWEMVMLEKPTEREQWLWMSAMDQLDDPVWPEGQEEGK